MSQSHRAIPLLSTVAFASTLTLVPATTALAQRTNSATLTHGLQDKSLSAKCDDFLKAQWEENTGWVRVIVRSSQVLTGQQEVALKAIGADIYRRLPVINAVAIRVPRRNLKHVAALSFAERLSADVTVKKNDHFTVENTGASTAWSAPGVTGKGVGIAVLDSGIYAEHPDLTNGDATKRVVAGASFVGGSADKDDCGHGTHIAGIVGGNGSFSSKPQNTQTFYGIAPSAQLISIRVLDGQGSGTVSNAVAGVQWAIANKSARNIRVLNLSLGHDVGESYKTDPLCLAVEAAWKAGIVVVCAAGNSGRSLAVPLPFQSNEGYGTSYGSIQSPGNSPYAITVGAMKRQGSNRSQDRIATYSSRGPSRLDHVLKPDLVAPGNQIVSLNGEKGKTILSKFFGSTNEVPWREFSRSNYSVGKLKASDAYFRLSGTSMAAPVVAGAAALLLQADPSLSPDSVKARLMITADKWLDPSTGLGDPNTYGAGYLNIPAALRATRVIASTYARSPELVRSGSRYVILDPLKAIWGISGVDGSKAIWGVSGVYDTKAIWGTQAIWGEQSSMGNDYLFANSTLLSAPVWEDQAIWGTGFAGLNLNAITLFGEK